jgi:16S rRNA (adenine1518-N6/adenine1519-N6)-dimethyltransferase
MDGHRARKRFGQNFLVDQSYIQKIVDAVGPLPGDAVVEIGPGLGALTEPLLRRLNQLHVIEIDRDLVARLRARDEAIKSKLVVHESDALKFDFTTLPSPLKIVGNLPYNISSPLLFHIAETAPHVSSITVMLQKEVVDRMCATPDTPDYGRLSVMLQATFAIKRLFIVPPGAFRPVPNVDSAVAQLIPLPQPLVPAAQFARFSAIVTAAFGQRRKTLRNALKGILTEAQISAAGINLQARGETLGVGEFVRLASLPLGAVVEVN